MSIVSRSEVRRCDIGSMRLPSEVDHVSRLFDPVTEAAAWRVRRVQVLYLRFGFGRSLVKQGRGTAFVIRLTKAALGAGASAGR